MTNQPLTIRDIDWEQFAKDAGYINYLISVLIAQGRIE